MDDFFTKATERKMLRNAWFRIRTNGIRSPLLATRNAIEHFERDAETNIARLQRKIRKGSFIFDPQTGVLKEKKSGSKRGIVMASVNNRVVERALLDCLQQNSPYVKDVINTQTSVGGVPDRSVPHGLAIINEALNDGKTHFIRSDISGFFDNVPRQDVISILRNEVKDESFIKLLDSATSVTLGNEKSLGEDRKVFPTYEDGVAQGSPLSPLFGNILLKNFDEQLNGRGIVCVRFIDDFVILGSKREHVEKAFKNAKSTLNNLGLSCHNPYDKNTSKDKAQFGDANESFIFLGYIIKQNYLSPSDSAKKQLLDKIDYHIKKGRASIIDVLRSEDSFKKKQRYVQTLDVIDRVIRGWGDSFAYSNDPKAFDDLDVIIDDKIKNFRVWYKRQIANSAGRKNIRRTVGIGLLTDIRSKSLDALPFRFEKNKKLRNVKNMILVSTDGSALIGANQDSGYGGWGAVFHSENKEILGFDFDVTNNQMELTAVIEALKITPIESRVRIRTDSKYVYRAVHEGTLISSNIKLWRNFETLYNQRRVDIEWVRGHSGDEYNEKADKLANIAREQGMEIKNNQKVLQSKRLASVK